MLTSCLSQKGKTPVVLARKTEVKAAFAQHTIITDDNKNTLLLSCARFALVSRLRVLLQAGANVEHTDKVRILACLRDVKRVVSE